MTIYDILREGVSGPLNGVSFFFSKDLNLSERREKRNVSFYELIHCNETESVIVKPCSVRQSWGAILLNFFSKNKKQF